MIKTKIIGGQQAKAELRKAMENFKSDNSLVVGIQEGAGEHGDGDEGITNAQLGAVLHFGNDHTPARPWLDIGVAQGNEAYAAEAETMVADGATLDEVLTRLGPMAQAYAQAYMIDLKTPANAPETIARKGSANPLIDEGELKGSVTHQVVPANSVNEGIG